MLLFLPFLPFLHSLPPLPLPQSKMSGDVWEHIRSLDETENWNDRNAVISKADHQAHTTWARVREQQ